MTGAPGLIYQLDRTRRANHWREWKSAGRVLRSEIRRHNRYEVGQKFAFDLNTSALKNTTNSREKQMLQLARAVLALQSGESHREKLKARGWHSPGH